jgi:tRNA(Phe) wybutosine-synthesizing methylase Tyw3
MLTDKEFNNLITQINEAFGNITERVQTLEKEVEELKKPKRAARTTTKENT